LTNGTNGYRRLRISVAVANWLLASAELTGTSKISGLLANFDDPGVSGNPRPSRAISARQCIWYLAVYGPSICRLAGPFCSISRLPYRTPPTGASWTGASEHQMVSLTLLLTKAARRLSGEWKAWAFRDHRVRRLRTDPDTTTQMATWFQAESRPDPRIRVGHRGIPVELGTCFGVPRATRNIPSRRVPGPSAGTRARP